MNGLKAGQRSKYKNMQDNSEKLTLEEIRNIVQALPGQKAWDAQIGVGNFLLIDFGKTISDVIKATRRKPERTYQYGEWSLWLYSCQWRIEYRNLILASTKSETREEMEIAVKRFNDRIIESIDITEPFWDAVFTFSDGYIIRTFSTSTEREHWTLRTPSGKYLAAGPGTDLEYRP